ncbi:MAG: hypothetical protein WAW02_11935 [Sideroxyarcus sp.]
MNKFHVYVFSVLIAITCLTNSFAEESYEIKERVTPSGFEAEATFFEFVKWPGGFEGVLVTSKAPHWNLDMLAKYIPSEGITFEDVNYLEAVHISRDKILRSLKARKGYPFKTFASLSYVYSIPYKQYSSLSFEKQGESSVVKMANKYVFTFRHTSKGIELVRCANIENEGE